VCRSTNPHNKRTRASILVEDSGESSTRILVDTTPDLRTQMIRNEVSWLSSIVWTHPHNDHIIGLDDLRPLSDRQGYIPGYANAETTNHLQRVFDYALVAEREHGGFPRVSLHELSPNEQFKAGNIVVTALPILHGKREIFAYRFEYETKTLVYATDCSFIPDESRPLMSNADVLVLGALRHEDHPAHFTIAQALAEAERLQPKHTFFTHIGHDLDHETENARLPAHVSLAYDGLQLEF
jgi:phosphoribosyl 1,2-cyclic phosphate phosphodiesterase